MSYLFIVNPIAGKGKAKRTIPIIEEIMENSKHSYQIKITEKVGDGQLFAEDAKAEGFHTIVSVGGDGTLHEVVNGMAGGVQKLGIIPAGTGNDFARSLNIPFDIEDAMGVLVQGKAMSIDLGRLDDKYFINFCSVGLDALIAEEANKIKRYFSSTYSYIIGVIKALGKFKSLRVELIIDDKKYDEEVMLVAVCNGAYYGGGMKIAPQAEVFDGQFDICVVRKMSKLKLLFLFPTIFKGKHIKYDEVKIYRGRDIQIFSEGNMHVNADGDIVDSRPIKFEILHNKMEVIVGVRFWNLAKDTDKQLEHSDWASA
ncbi:MAG: diacylglycerol/lipid kinase family protein [Natronincolaceae bacterium]|nr:diacylglycerol kinase family lipid kinase [Bacillota bacterium]